VTTLDAPARQAGTLEHLQVLAHDRLRDGQGSGHRAGLASEVLEDGAPGVVKSGASPRRLSESRCRRMIAVSPQQEYDPHRHVDAAP
jgi:hypothetical protein